MKRFAMEQLVSWKDNPKRKPLVIQGARQVGKTWLMKEFGKQYYKNVAYISFNDSALAQSVFEGDYNVNNIIASLSVISNTTIEPENTLIIFDEIQECERALNCLKFFNENAPQYHIIVAGSLLGVAVRKKKMSFPVGQVEFLTLYPLSFYEFLSAIGENVMLEQLYSNNWEVIKTLHIKYTTLLKQYMFIGGMPEAVKTFIDTNDYNAVRTIQNQIITGYQDDFSKYTENANISKINAVWNSIPYQLAKDNQKFSYSTIAPSARAREYEDAIEWLRLCGLIYKIPKISKPDLPLSSYAEGSIFKVYMIDVGLLCAKALLDANVIINGDKIFEEFKGSLTEQYVYQEIVKTNDIQICYWESSATAEVDFVIQYKNNVIPVEVKSAENLKAKSLALYRQKYTPAVSVRTALTGFEINTGLYNIPLYSIESMLDIIRKSEKWK